MIGHVADKVRRPDLLWPGRRIVEDLDPGVLEGIFEAPHKVSRTELTAVEDPQPNECHARYRQILLARPIVPLSNRDLGFLPGDGQSKIDPYMQAQNLTPHEVKTVLTRAGEGTKIVLTG